MFSSDADHPTKNIKISQDDKFFGRQSSRKTSVSYASYDECDGLTGAVPFNWESQPGTPKNTLASVASDTSRPRPLTPPPSQLGAPKYITFPDNSLRRTLTSPLSQAQLPNSPKNTTSPDVSFRRPLPPPPSFQSGAPKNTNFPDSSLHPPLAPPPFSRSGATKNTNFHNISILSLTPPPSSQTGTPKNTNFPNISVQPLTPPPSSQSGAQNNKTVSNVAHNRPLTPPPSYNFERPDTSTAKPIKLKHSRSLLLGTLLTKIFSLRKSINMMSSSKSSASLSPSPSQSSLSSRSWSSSTQFLTASAPKMDRGEGSWPSTQRSSFNGKAEDEEDNSFGSSNSSVCFSIAFGRGTRLNVVRCYGCSR
ncbi:hypothetical protein SLA2020_321400 [Shorea laevis]